MCDPITMAISSFALSAVSGVVGYAGQMQQAAVQDSIYEQNKLNAQQAFADKTNALGMRQQQEQDSAATEKQDAALDARAARATTQVAAAQNGVSGITIDGLLRDIYSQEGRYASRVDTNLDWTTQQLQADRKGAGYEMANQINSVPRGERPNFINLGLKIAGAGMDAYGTYQKLKK